MSLLFMQRGCYEYKNSSLTAEQLENIIAQYPTPFHIYDEEGIIENMKSFINAFSWNKGFKQYFAVKATPNPYIMRVHKNQGQVQTALPWRVVVM